MNAPGRSNEIARAQSQALLRIEDLCVRRGDSVLIDSVTLEVPLASRTVILGPNGAGKTSLLHAIQGVVRPERGTIVALDIQGARREFSRALVFQRPVMLRRSVQANLQHALAAAGVARRARAALAERALARVGVGMLAARPARSLSGGEQQRVAIARALACAPECLLLDEPCASLDPGAAAGIERLLLDLAAAGHGILMSTHDLAQARRMAQWIVFVHRGRVLEVTPAGRFFAAPDSAPARRFVAGQWIED